MSDYRLMKPISIGTGKHDLKLYEVRFPVLASYKLDGIRACVQRGRLLSNSGKRINNEEICAMYERPEFEGLDGELCYGQVNGKNLYNLTQSIVNSRSTPAGMDIKALSFQVFDLKLLPQLAYAGAYRRYGELEVLECRHFELWQKYNIFKLEQEMIHDAADLQSFYARARILGHEGAMFKAVYSYYKTGRSTAKEQCLMRMKPFGTEFYEAQIIEVCRAYANENEATTDEFGNTSRSSHQANKVPKNEVGSFRVKDTLHREFYVSAGSLTLEQRKYLWSIRLTLPGEWLRYTCLTHGEKDVPRSPVFRGFRDLSDFSPTGEF